MQEDDSARVASQPCGAHGDLPRSATGPSESDIREQLAALAHEQWSGWMKYLFSRCGLFGRGDWDRAMLVIPVEWETRWKRLMETRYDDLTDAEKDSDRKEADRVLATLAERHPFDGCTCGHRREGHHPWGRCHAAGCKCTLFIHDGAKAEGVWR